MENDNSEKLENCKGEGKEAREIYASLYFNALRRQLQEYDEGECTSFEEMDEEILEDLDEHIEPYVEDKRPDLIIKRIKGLQFLIINREKYEEKRDETDI